MHVTFSPLIYLWGGDTLADCNQQFIMSSFTCIFNYNVFNLIFICLAVIVLLTTVDKVYHTISNFVIYHCIISYSVMVGEYDLLSCLLSLCMVFSIRLDNNNQK